jgi:putative ABC transport system substrate-binding protein
MLRREFIAGLGSAAAWPVVARAQQAALPVVGLLSAQSADEVYKNFTAPFLQGLKETGYVEGQNVAVEYRYADNQYDRLPSLAADLVRRRVAVIVAVGFAAVAAKAATTTIPIVFNTGGDPVAMGLVTSLNRPGANLTGFTNLGAELAPKQLQLLRQLIPTAVMFGVLVDPGFPGTPSMIASLQAAAPTLGLQLLVVNDSRTDSDLESVFATFSQQHVGALLVGPSGIFARRTEQLTALAARHALPAIFTNREYALAGGLMSYGTILGYSSHQAGIYVGRILRGEKPADLPVQNPTKFELVINLKTAKALGLTIPETLLATADEVIQ